MVRRTIRAHYDGQFIVPEEPVDVPPNLPLLIQISPAQAGMGAEISVEERLRRLALATGIFSGPALPDEALRRESIYDDRL